MDPIEIEVKFYLKNLNDIREKLLALGARPSGEGPVFETNIRFEDKDNRFFKSKQLLRLRQDTRPRLTFKSEPPERDPDFKTYRELEVEVGDFSTMKKILEAIGFQPAQIYEKYRETLVIGKTHFCLDRMPYGNFLEIEGEKSDIRDMAGRLGLPWEDRILDNYLRMFEFIKKAQNLPFSDVTFNNFLDHQVSFEKFAQYFNKKD